MESIKRLRLLLGDQLNHQHSWFQEPQEDTAYLMAEMSQETTQVTHHIQKLTAFFLGMRGFAKMLSDRGIRVYYQPIHERAERTLEERILERVQSLGIQKFEFQLPDNYRLDQELREICKKLECLSVSSQAYDTEHFLTERYTLTDFFKGKKQLLMESFYRMMRKKHHVLMEGDQPIGKKWNFDHENRKPFKGDIPIASGPIWKKTTEVQQILDEITQSGIPTLGKITASSFNWPVTRKEAQEQLQFFCKHLLQHFGNYQDALYDKDPFLFHSKLSFALNSKLIHPKEVIEASIEEFSRNESITLSTVEGFVRQILGWREYMRGIYWREMPAYAEKNHFNHQRPLPDFYWTGATKMKCLSHAIGQTLEYSYAHHIQRLMVTGNFALLAEIDPKALDTWYLGVYLDAIEWVEITNTRGMSQFADGGIIATKPYISSGAYIDKMSNYCKSCTYDVKERTGENSCPFNSLYWNFLEKKRAQLQSNPRMGMMYRVLDRKNPEELSSQISRAEDIIANPDRY